MQTLERFIGETVEQQASGRFGNESARTLRIEVDGGVWLKPGAAVAYRGEITFERQRVLTAPSIIAAVLREAAPLVHRSVSWSRWMRRSTFSPHSVSPRRKRRLLTGIRISADKK